MRQGLSLVHTILYIVAPLRDGGYKALHEQFYKPGGFEVCRSHPVTCTCLILPHYQAPSRGHDLMAPKSTPACRH